MSVRIKKGTSRLVHAELYVIDGIEFWGRPELPDMTSHSTDTLHEVRGPDRMDTISRERYQNDEFWWTIAHRNNLRLIPNELIEGHRLVIADPTRIRKELF